MTYITRQQKAVLACLRARQGSCVSAQELADALHENGERVGVATVYRQLERLEQTGCVHKVLTEDGAFYRYCPEGERGDCFLLKCERCGNIAHMDCAHLAPLYRHLETDHDFSVDPRRTMLYGVCGACRKASAREAAQD